MTSHVYSLGELVCDLEPGTIPASDPKILEKLKLCPALTGAQQDALNALLLSGGTAYGDPSSWDLRTLQDLGPLVLALNQTTLSLVAEAAREDFRRSIAAAYINQGRSQREKSLILLRALAAASAASQPRLKRSADRCQSKPITASNISDIFLYLSPDMLDQLDLCLSNDVLIQNLEAVLAQPITSKPLRVLKKKVDEYFQGSGIPEEQLRRLGVLSRLYTEQEISQWPVTSSDTLSALLNGSGGAWDDSQVQQLLSRYLALGGSLTGPLLQEITGRRLCNLQEGQIQQISAAAIGTAGRLDISSCSQSKKKQLYGKAREAFASLASTPGPYYCQIQPYLGGAPAEDLKNLANAGVAINMDLDTFLSLIPEELQKLSVTDVKHLLGKNLPELKEHEQEPSVVSWVQLQSQRELDCVLGIGLQGGRPEPAGTASPAATSPATASTHPSSVTSMATASTPVPTTLASVTSPVATTAASVTSPATATTSVPTTPASVTTPAPTTPATASTPVPTILASVTSMATATTPTAPTTLDSVTSMGTVPTSPHPASSANVTPVSTTVPGTSASATTIPNVPSTSATPPTATSTARPSVTSAVPCSTHQAPSTDRATSPAVTLLSTLLATSSPSATPVPAVTSRATTSTGVGTNPAVPPQPSLGSSTAAPCPPSSRASPRPTAGSVPEPAQTASNGYINLRPPPGSGSRLCSCLALLLAATVGKVLLL
ncbi:mesothelin-like protein [Passer montanus]|uniref:mesothelin-like protein n=1 Tax=Passer montanus TaxID=9160 RepID=UPI0019606FDB|nr:mesothelin-like protein [Passer montanus]